MPVDDPLLAAYRIIRRLEAPTEAPWPALLAHDDTSSVLLVDLGELGDGWPGWRASWDGHLAAPEDLVRRVDGHYAAFAAFGDRVSDFLVRRHDAALTDGECLTLAVSGLRGLAEAGFLPAGEHTGEWWLTEGGRPVFAFQPAGPPIAQATLALLDDVRAAASPRLTAVLDECIEVAAEPTRLARSLPRLEEALFAVAAPEALATTVFAPRRVRGIAATPGAADADVEPAEPGLLTRLARHVDADLADAFSRATTAVWRRFRATDRPSRRKPMITAGLIAGAVLAGGLLWPSGGPATAEGGRTPSPVATDAAPAPGGEREASVPPSPAPARTGQTVPLDATLDALLTARASCDDDGCRAALQEDPSAPFAAGVIDLPPAARTVTLLDEFGGAAVLRVDAAAGGQPSQLVVIVQKDETWVLRDVHDVGEHPR